MSYIVSLLFPIKFVNLPVSITNMYMDNKKKKINNLEKLICFHNMYGDMTNGMNCLKKCLDFLIRPHSIITYSHQKPTDAQFLCSNGF